MRGFIILMFVLVLARSAVAFTITFDYSTDTNDFFASGSEARDTLVAAGGFFESIITDDYAAIVPTHTWSPPAAPGQNMWQARFTNPTTGLADTRDFMTVAADTIVVFVGARNLGGSQLAEGGQGGYGVSAFDPSFVDAVQTRGEGANDVGVWGGFLAMNSTSTWNYDHDVLPMGSENDLYSTVLHELGHVLGFGISASWTNLINTIPNPDTFSGAEVVAVYGSQPELDAATGNAHWEDSVMSTVYGGGPAQEAAMDPNLTVGTRKLFTDLDVAALDDIGWDIAAPVPEPSSAFLAAVALGAGLCLRRPGR